MRDNRETNSCSNEELNGENWSRFSRSANDYLFIVICARFADMYRNENVFIWFIERDGVSPPSLSGDIVLVNALSRHTFVLLHKPLNITDPNYLNICIEFEITTCMSMRRIKFRSKKCSKMPW